MIAAGFNAVALVAMGVIYPKLMDAKKVATEAAMTAKSAQASVAEAYGLADDANFRCGKLEEQAKGFAKSRKSRKQVVEQEPITLRSGEVETVVESLKSNGALS